eukprot:jgi/Psemu1/57817/gm1.57817_g
MGDYLSDSSTSDLTLSSTDAASPPPSPFAFYDRRCVTSDAALDLTNLESCPRVFSIAGTLAFRSTTPISMRFLPLLHSGQRLLFRLGGGVYPHDALQPSPLLVNQGVYVLRPKASPYNPQPWDLIIIASTGPKGDVPSAQAFPSTYTLCPYRDKYELILRVGF